MSFSDFFANMKRHNENAAVIFDRAEPIGRATDLVMPRRHWFARRDRRRILRPFRFAAKSERS
jgi:hypothetical protein